MNILQCGKLMYKKGYACGTAGNISVRKPDGVEGIDVTRSGSHIGLLQPTDIIYMDEKGNYKANPLLDYKPTIELPTHLGIYEIRPEINAVIHAHLVNVLVADDIDNRWFEYVSTEQSDYYLDTAGMLATTGKYYQSGSDGASNAVLKLVKDGNSVIIAMHHGVWLLGVTLREAFIRLEVLSELAEFYIKWKTLKTGL